MPRSRPDDVPDLAVSDDAIREHCYLVARGVRSLALAGHVRADPMVMLRTATRIERLSAPGAVPFVLDRGDGWASCGFAAAGWVLELYRWALTAGPNAVPERQRDRIVGLLLGYSPEAIRAFEEEGGGRLFSGPTASPAPASR